MIQSAQLFGHYLLYRYGAERGINTFHVITERGCDDMKPSDFQKTIQCQFDCKLKRVVKGIVRNYRKELKQRRNKEISYCELPEIVVEKLAVWDEYESDYTAFDVCGIEVRVLDDDLAEAIKYLLKKMAVKTQLFSALLQTLSATDTLIPAPRSTHYRCKFTYANVSENFPTNTTLRRKAPSPHPTPPTAHPQQS